MRYAVHGLTDIMAACSLGMSLGTESSADAGMTALVRHIPGQAGRGVGGALKKNKQ